MSTPLEYLRDKKSRDCTRCSLHRHRTRIVFGYGPEDASIMILGMAPSPTEDEKGLPLVGPPGALLDNLLSRAGVSPEETYKANLVMCRPPSDRNPTLEEIQRCALHLHLQIRLVRPKVILALGELVGRTITGEYGTPMEILRPRTWEYENRVTGYRCPVVVTEHPAWVLKRLQDPRARLYAQRALGDIERAVELAHK